MDDRPNYGPRPNFNRPPGPFPFQQRPGSYNPRPLQPNRDITANMPKQVPQVTIHQTVPLPPGVDPQSDPKIEQFPQKVGNRPMDFPMEQEVRMLPVQLPSNVPSVGMTGKKVLINPHFKGNFQPPVEGKFRYVTNFNHIKTSTRIL